MKSLGSRAIWIDEIFSVVESPVDFGVNVTLNGIHAVRVTTIKLSLVA